MKGQVFNSDLSMDSRTHSGSFDCYCRLLMFLVWVIVQVRHIFAVLSLCRLLTEKDKTKRL